MTIDAFLNMVLTVIIPVIMAAMGGFLAAKVLPVKEKSSIERWAWMGAFVFLAVIAIVLSFYQQVRVTNKEELASNERHKYELASNGEIKFLQGQQDTTNNLLGKLIQSNSLPQATIEILRGLRRPEPTQAVKDKTEYPHYLTNRQLREDAERLVASLRDLLNRANYQEQKFAQEYNSVMAATIGKNPKEWTDLEKQQRRNSLEGQGQRMLTLNQTAIQEYNTRFRADAVLIRNEILARLPREEHLLQKQHECRNVVRCPSQYSRIKRDRRQPRQIG
jgi:hypothetical protein